MPAQATTSSLVKAGQEGVLMLVAAGVAAGLGAAIGKHSFLVGLPVFGFGVYKGNNYISAAGLGMVMANGFQKAQAKTTAVSGIDGFDLKQIANDAKERVTTFFSNFSDKLYIPPSSPPATVPEQSEATSGLDDQVTYFVNPYPAELDMSAIDRVQEQIAQMNQKGTAGLNDIEREF